MKNETSYAIVNKHGSYLYGFHDGDFTIKGIFSCSRLNRMSFDTIEDANDKIAYIIKTCEEQRPRWKAFTDEVLTYAKNLKPVKTL